MFLRLLLSCGTVTALVTALFLGVANGGFPAEGASCGECIPCCQFNELNSQIRDAKADRNYAQSRLRVLIPLIRENYYTRGGLDWTAEEWAFPLDGYGWKAIGGRKGSGYRPKGHDYFDGNRHKAHAAHDIFIRDKDRDCLDDRTGKPVMVRSMTNGIVVAEETEWDPSSPLRGGRYIWIYDPTTNGLVYYAHNETIFVALGDMVKPGDVIATVGRTGLNAFKKKSPTHLHLAYLEVHEGEVIPRNFYDNLVPKMPESKSTKPLRTSSGGKSHQRRIPEAAVKRAPSPATLSSLEHRQTGNAETPW